ncbi:MAG: M23 family metallopeptidase [Rhodobacterales bacterium]
MRLRYWTAIVVIGCVTLVVAMRRDAPVDAPPVPIDTAAEDLQDHDTAWMAGDDLLPPASEKSLTNPVAGPVLPDSDVIWSRAIAPGESLYVLLAEAGLDSVARVAVASAIESEFDLRRLQPGHLLTVGMTSDGTLEHATLEVENGVRIQAIFGAEPSVHAIPPELESVRLAGEASIGSSIYAALDAAGIPTRFATDLELVLAGSVNFRTVLSGGEHLRLFWRENRLDDRVIGEPTIDFAEIDLGGERYEILWPDDDAVRTKIYKDGSLLLSFDQPIKGARLSSPFGMRTHPVHGNARMHRGLDFAADLGTPVQATQSGRIAFAGRRVGYGLMVEIDHADNMRTLYAHLSAVNEALEVGQRITKGDTIGRVGSTGTSTAPHLHYEVLVNDRPVPPLTDERLSRLGGGAAAQVVDPDLIVTARDELARLLQTPEVSAEGSSY